MLTRPRPHSPGFQSAQAFGWILSALIGLGGRPVLAADGEPAEPTAPPTAATTSKELHTFDDLELDLVALMNTEIKVVTATKTAQTLADAPAIIEVITADDIRRWGFRNVAEVLQHTAGFYVIDDHILPNVSVRGVAGGLMSESGMIKVMIDGRPVAFRSTAGNWLDAGLIPIGVISRIEIIRGPASALYGADAFLGVVNIITKSGQEAGGFNLAVAGKMLNAQSDPTAIRDNLGIEYDVIAGERWGNFDLLVSVGGESQDRAGLQLPSTSPAVRIPSYNQGETRSQGLTHNSTAFFTKLRYSALDGKLRLEGSYSGSWIDRGGDFAHWAQLTNGKDDLGRTNGTLISLRQRRAELAADIQAHPTASVRLRAGYFDGEPREDDRIEVASDFFYVRRSFGYRGFTGGAEVVWSPLTKLQFVAGAEVVYDRETLPNNARIDKATGETFDDGDQSEQQIKALVNPGAYLQVNWLALDPRLRLTGGLRYDYHNIYGSQWAGRAGIVSHWGQRRNVTTKLLYGSAFKAPSPLLLFATPLRPGDIIGNESLDPQIIHTFESQLAWTPLREIRFTTGVTYSLLIDKAEFRPQGINITAQNVSNQQGISWETRADLSRKKWFKSYVSFDLQYGLRKIDQAGYVAELIGTENVVHPLWIGRAGIDLAISKARISIMAQGMLVGRRRAADTNLVENGSEYYLPMYFILNGGIRTDAFRIFGRGRTSFSLQAYNLTNTKVPDPGFSGYDYPRLPLEVMLKVTHAHR